MGTPVEANSMMLRAIFLLTALGISLVSSENSASGKAFSLFNVVTFKNEDCVSTSTSAGSGPRNGTCYTSEECSEKGGTAAGGCAMGFGTCCLFAVTCDGDVKENCTYIRNENFPTQLDGDSIDECSFEIEKCVEEVCTLRLDFESFNILAGTGTLDSLSACQDSFEITNPNLPGIPAICGDNTGEHIFIEMGDEDKATLAFKFAAVDAKRTFEIKVTQYACNSVMRPPEGCLQYYTGTEGRIKTFNFAGDNHHLPNQKYSICIRQEMGFCCNRYSVCADDRSYSLFTFAIATAAMSQTGSLCTEDWIEIAGSSETCGGPVAVNKYCGDLLTTDITTGVVNGIVCDCTPPFAVGIKTDNVFDADGTTANNDADATTVSRGVCLNYVQSPC